ncbi:twitch domain-containing radical SAM protein [Hoeflea poritis]|uniref:Twitch domain-containing radical SAM protein n=1 Tax=Hoeflea poritis TaxID=2993659 RepID=A0ABT4VW07_9HYPH|nr:twitch domain-containing radical SAM protein [Hoeflea poritis]MDA4848385.1 twitch domain-containing radical SAM protein [Hoeflea poritis]
MADGSKSQNLPRGFCILPWINQHIATTGAISPCCEFDGDVANLSQSSLNEAWNSNALEEIRNAFLEGRPLPACRKCFDRETHEGASLRLESNRLFSHWIERYDAGAGEVPEAPPHPVSYDLRFSNLCNFRCRSCWHGSSSRWYSDGKAIGVTMADKAEINSFRNVDDFIGQVGAGLDGVERIYFAGGEPLMMSEHYALLEQLIRCGRTDVALAYNSNMSVNAFRGQSIFDLWRKFPNIKVAASVDATGDLGAMVRNGFDWEVFASNIQTLRESCPHVDLEFGVTVSVLNIRNLRELLEALEREFSAPPGAIYLHSLQEPEFYSTQILPAWQKRRVSKDLEAYVEAIAQRTGPAGRGRDDHIRLVRGIIDYMNGRDLSAQFEKFARMTRKLDTLRGEDSLGLLPELAPYLGRSQKKLPRMLRKVNKLLPGRV